MDSTQRKNYPCAYERTGHMNHILRNHTLCHPYKNNKDAYQPPHLSSQISAFVVHCLDSTIPMLAKSKISRLYLVSITAQADLSLAWMEICEDRFFRDMAHIMDRVKRIWYLLPMRAGKVQASLRIRAVSPEPLLLAHTSSESRGTFRQKARSLAPLNGWACAVKICHDGMLEDTNSLDGAHIMIVCSHNTITVIILVANFVCLSGDTDSMVRSRQL